MTRALAEVIVIAIAMADSGSGGGKSAIAYGVPVATRSVYFSFTPVKQIILHIFLIIHVHLTERHDIY